MSCNECKERSEIKFSWMIILSIEILITSVLGHIYVINELIPVLKSFF